MTNRRCDISECRWLKAVDIFELGLKNGREIADLLGVSAQTISREMKRRGALKGSRAHETQIDIVAHLDRKASQEAEMQDHILDLKIQRHAATHAVLNRMMAAVKEADRRGDLTLASPVIHETASTFGKTIR